MTLIVNLILGVPLLIWGRKLFWLFVGAVGFITGFWLGENFFSVREEWLMLALGAILGLVGILLAIMVQKIAVTITGFLASVYLVLSAMEVFKLDLGPWNWFIYIAGGIIGSMFVVWMFDWALIIFSSLIGAALISQTSFEMIRFGLGPRTIIFIVLLVIGLIVQYDQKQRDT